MRNVRQLPYALPEVFSMQVGDTVFGHDVMHIRPRRHHTGTRFQLRSDLADRIVLRGRWKGDDRFPPFA
jgi:hypothetical protein